MTTSPSLHDAMKFLALGDSYTIGEGVRPADRWPSLLAALLKQHGHLVDRITYVARTGWTTGDLLDALLKEGPQDTYDRVFLLIGVNNQYRGQSLERYESEFNNLLQKAIAYAGDEPLHTIVLSIPDWSVSPFAAEKNRAEIARQIDQFNEVNARITRELKGVYINITRKTRNQSAPDFFTADTLHPNRLAYESWAQLVLPVLRTALEE